MSPSDYPFSFFMKRKYFIRRDTVLHVDGKRIYNTKKKNTAGRYGERVFVYFASHASVRYRPLRTSDEGRKVIGTTCTGSRTVYVRKKLTFGIVRWGTRCRRLVSASGRPSGDRSAQVRLPSLSFVTRPVVVNGGTYVRGLYALARRPRRLKFRVRDKVT